jgi:hypothetical protein
LTNAPKFVRFAAKQMNDVVLRFCAVRVLGLRQGVETRSGLGKAIAAYLIPYIASEWMLGLRIFHPSHAALL